MLPKIAAARSRIAPGFLFRLAHQINEHVLEARLDPLHAPSAAPNRFFNLPLQLWSLLGAVIAGISLIYGASRILRTFLYGVDVPGYESLIVAILFLGGVQLLSLGVLGGYIGRIFNEVKARPLYIVRHTYGLDETKE